MPEIMMQDLRASLQQQEMPNVRTVDRRRDAGTGVE
jgi:hypothetical protein